MAVTLAGGCRVSHMHEGEPLVQGTLRVWPQIGRATGAEAISLSVMEFATGMSPTIHNDHCDQIVYLLSNESRPASKGSSAVTIVVDCQSVKVDSDTGVYIRPDQTFAIHNPGSGAVTLISSQCPDPDRSIQFTNATPISQSPGPIQIVRLADQKAQPTADRWYRLLIDERVGSTQVTQFVGSIPPGRAPDHFHHYEEVLFILKGSGRMWAGETNTPVDAGSCIYLPKGQVHCVENTGEDELRLLGVFYPAGSPSVRYDT
jgi:mannose-6-phosphate isomerase-like protein (cupin superfamily)